MKISLHYSHSFEQKFGGISKYLVELTRALAKTNNSVKIFSILYQNQYLRDVDKKVNEGIFIKNINPGIHRYAGYAAKKIKRIRNEIYRPDIFHLTHYSPKAYKPKLSKQVLTFHGFGTEIIKDNQYSHHFEIKKKAVSQSDMIIAISENTKKDILRLIDVSENKIRVIHHGVHLPLSLEKDKNLSKVSYILYVGDRSAYKNWAGFIKAYSNSYRLMNDFKVYAFGGGEPSSNEKDFINSNCPGKVEFVSGNDDMLHDYYINASAFVYPSSYEGFGLPPLEAMARFTPVFVSNSTAIPEVVGDTGFYFDPEDPDSIMDCFESNIYDADRMENAKKAGFDRAKIFSWQKCANKTLNLYKEIV